LEGREEAMKPAEDRIRAGRNLVSTAEFNQLQLIG
jgi:hypothetical protein